MGERVRVQPELFEVVGFGADDAPGASRESSLSTVTSTTATTPGTATATSTPTPAASPLARRSLQLRNDQGARLGRTPCRKNRPMNGNDIFATRREDIVDPSKLTRRESLNAIYWLNQDLARLGRYAKEVGIERQVQQATEVLL